MAEMGGPRTLRPTCIATPQAFERCLEPGMGQTRNAAVAERLDGAVVNESPARRVRRVLRRRTTWLGTAVHAH